MIAAGWCVLNWFIPGAGYMAVGDLRRGLALFAILNGVFVIGLYWGGYYLAPVPRSHADFSIVAWLSYGVQLFHGAGWMLCTWAQESAGTTENPAIRFLAGRPAAEFSDLGSFHLLVAAGLNYLTTVRLWDLLRGLDEDVEKKRVETSENTEVSA